MNRFACAMALLAAAYLPAGSASMEQLDKSKLKDLEWMAGAWIESKNGAETEEHWMAPKGTLMMGMNRMVLPGGKMTFENLRIAQAGEKIIYYASPGGRQPATEFTLLKLEKKKATFENPENPFPRRIIYWLESDGGLAARIEGVLQGREASREWHWKKVEAASPMR